MELFIGFDNILRIILEWQIHVRISIILLFSYLLEFSIVRRNYGAGDYQNTSNNRIKDTIAKASSILLDDQFQNDGLSIGGGLDRGLGGYGASGLPPHGGIQRNSSQPPIYSYGGLKSNYTASEADPSDFDTHS